MLSKDQLRECYLKQRQAISLEDVHALSEQIIHHLHAYFNDNPIAHLVGYSATKNEPNVTPFLQAQGQQGCSIFLPRFTPEGYDCAQIQEWGSDIQRGRYNISAPKACCPSLDKDLMATWLIPGLCFDKAGYRLGFGKGIYDQLLKGQTGPKIGIAFQWQLTDSLPRDDWDIPCDVLITEKGVL